MLACLRMRERERLNRAFLLMFGFCSRNQNINVRSKYFNISLYRIHNPFPFLFKRRSNRKFLSTQSCTYGCSGCGTVGKNGTSGTKGPGFESSHALFLKPWASFCLFSFFSNIYFTEKTVDICGIRTRIVIVKGKHADHLTSSTAHELFLYRTFVYS